VFWRAFNAGAALNVRVFRLSRGRLGGTLKGARIVLVHHIGARTGKHRVSPLMGMLDGDRVVIVASKGGIDTNPSWYYNLLAHPDTEVEIGEERRHVRAHVADDGERAELWPKLVEFFPDFGDYATYTDRIIPVIVLEPA
jgi:deazaflavin-dependent oxidoreductase (nitroreductase family)